MKKILIVLFLMLTVSNLTFAEDINTENAQQKITNEKISPLK